MCSVLHDVAGSIAGRGSSVDAGILDDKQQCGIDGYECSVLHDHSGDDTGENIHGG